MGRPTERPPLKLLIEPQEYLCTWLVPTGDTVLPLPGVIVLGPNRPPSGIVYGDLPLEVKDLGGGQRWATFPQTLNCDHLIARLANGYEARLVDAHVGFWTPSQGRVSAASASVGVAPGWTGFGFTRPSDGDGGDRAATADPVVAYYRADIQIGALDAISGTSPFSAWHFPNPKEGQHLEGQWSVTGNPESSQEWADDDAQLRLEYDASVSVGNSYNFRFAVSPVVRVQVHKPLAVRDWVDLWVDPLRRIASVATGHPQDLTYLAVVPGDGSESEQQPRPKCQVFGSGITQAPYQSSAVGVRGAAAAVRLSTDEVSLLGMLRRWQELAKEHHPLIETYGSMLSSTDEHPRSRFLLLVQALEGLYGDESKTEYEERTGRHITTRDEVLSALEGAKLTPSQVKFLKRNLTKRPPRGLEEALRNLLGSLPVDLTPQLAACGLIGSAGVEPNGSDLHRVASALTKVRNDLAHGNRGYEASELHDVGQVLERIVRAHALRLLDCPTEVLKRVCDDEQ